MGTGKGSMDFWAARVPVSRVIFELKGEIHEQIVKDAFRVASAKMPGTIVQQPHLLLGVDDEQANTKLLKRATSQSWGSPSSPQRTSRSSWHEKIKPNFRSAS
jgi:hypothetical protein